MKKITMTFVLVTVMGAAVLASGNEKIDSRVGVVPMKENTYRVLYGVEEASVVKIKITDPAGHVLRNDRIKSNGGFMKPYNFEKVAHGTYTIVLSDQFGEVSKKIHIGKVQNSATAAK